LGWLLQNQKRTEEAIAAYRKASELDPAYVSPHIRLAQLYAAEGKWEDALKFSEEALSLDPVSYPQAYFLNGLACFRLNRLDRAEEIVRRGIRLDTDERMPKMHLILAGILTLKKDPSGSLDSLRRYLAAAPDAPNADLVKAMIKERENSIRASKGDASIEPK
jgi:tetratricopeptide (TPR) repeat protein